MRRLMMVTTLGVVGLIGAGCASTGNYASACERDYARNREQAAASGALLGAAAGAAIAGPGDRERGAALGAATSFRPRMIPAAMASAAITAMAVMGGIGSIGRIASAAGSAPHR